MNFIKRFSIVLVLAMMAVVLTACGKQNENTEANKVDIKSLPLNQQVDHIVNSMSEADKVGQLVMIGIHGQSVNSDSKYMIDEFKPGGIILFDRNMKDKEQVKTLIDELQKEAKKSEKLPMFIALDQEGGLVARMSDKLVKVPSAEKIGQMSRDDANAFALKSARELTSLGFNLNFAPVVDLGLTAQRSFSTNPDTVIEYAEVVGKGYHEGGVMYSFKHFPGIGKAKTDLHKETNSIDVDKDTLMKEDLKPYAYLLKHIDQSQYMVMVSHAIYPALDKDNPSCLSKPILQDILRKQLGFNGVIITDDMEMGAVANHYTFADMSVKAINAGVDIVLVAQEYKHAQEAYNGILKAVKSGEISKETLDAAVKRVVKMKLENHLIW